MKRRTMNKPILMGKALSNLFVKYIKKNEIGIAVASNVHEILTDGMMPNLEFDFINIVFPSYQC